MQIARKIGSVKEQRDREDMQAKIEKQQAILEYVAAMADIDLLVEASEDTHIEQKKEDGKSHPLYF